MAKVSRKRLDGAGVGSGTILTPEYLAAAEAVSEALRPLDRVAVEMEAKWGVGRLPRLVPPEVAALFGSAKAKLDQAIYANDPAEVAKRAAVMIRGWQKLDQVATGLGADALPVRTVGVDFEGRAYVVVWDRGDVSHAARTSGVSQENVVTVHELLTAYEVLKGRIAGIKQAFPGAEVARVSIPRGGDELGF
jgi:hypothetical protein